MKGFYRIIIFCSLITLIYLLYLFQEKLYKHEKEIKKKEIKKKPIKKVRFDLEIEDIPKLEDIGMDDDLDSVTGFSFGNDSSASETFDSEYSDNDSNEEDF